MFNVTHWHAFTPPVFAVHMENDSAFKQAMCPMPYPRPLWNFQRHKVALYQNSFFAISYLKIYTSRWRHNEHDSVSNHQPHGCLLNRLFRRRSKKTSKFRVTGLCVGNSLGPVNSPHKGQVTRKMFPFDDVIMTIYCEGVICQVFL